MSNSNMENVVGAGETFRIHGFVRNGDRRPPLDVIVRAFDRDLRAESRLGQSATDPREGRYEIAFDRSQFSRAEKGGPDLVLRVFGPGSDEPLFESPVLFNAGADERYDITLDVRDELSEFERYVWDVTPLLEGLSLGALSDEQRWFLAREAGIPDDRVAALSAAHRLARALVPAEALYALFRQGLPSDLRGLVLTPRRALREALVRSIDENVAPERLRPAVDRIVAALQGLAPNEIVGTPGKRSRLGRLLEIAGVCDAGMAKVVEAYADLEAPLRDLGDALSAVPELHGEPLERLELTAQLASLTRDNLPVMGRLMQRIRSLDDLAELEDDDWQRLVYGGSPGEPDLPPDAPGDTEVDRVRTYVAEIKHSLQQAIPMAYVRRSIARDESIDGRRREALGRFFERVPGFDFREAHVDRTIAEHGAALADVEDHAALVADLKRLQRVFRVAPRYDHMRALLDAGFDSALAIADTPLPRFLETMRDRLGGEMQTRSYHSQAQQTSALATNAYAGVHQHLFGAAPAAAGSASTDLLKDFPSLQELFGSLDLCACKHCRSVYGPAAYFVDVMQFVRKSGSPWSALLARRPDLEHIALTCENSNTPLPYVDLVNEILEFYVVNQGLSAQAAKSTEGHTAEELDALPQYVDDAAYARLKDAAHGPLPFHLPLETGRAYLERLGTSRHEVMETLRGPSGPNDLDLAAEFLKLSPQERAILLGLSAHTARDLFGYRQELAPPLVRMGSEGFYVRLLQRKLNTAGAAPPLDDDGVFGPITRAAVLSFQSSHGLAADGIVGPTTWGALEPIDPPAFPTILEHVPDLLKRAEISYQELSTLLRTRYVNPDQITLPDGTVVLYAPGSVCDLAKTTVEHRDRSALAESEWLRLHRFLRLWKRLGWTMTELDKTFAVLGKTEIDADFLIDLARIEALRIALRLPVVELLALWAPIDTYDPLATALPEGESAAEPSLYNRLFRNKTVLNPPDPAFDLTPPPSPEIALPEPISAHEPALIAALRVSSDDLKRLRATCDLGGEAEPLSLESVSRLYRHALLARALRLRVADYADLLALMGVDASSTPTPAETERLVERIRGVAGSGFRVSTLSFLYRHLAAPGVAPLEDTVRLTLERLRADLLRIRHEAELQPDPTGESLETSSRALVKQAATDATGLDAAAVRLLIEDDETGAALLRALGDVSRPAIDDLLALGGDVPPWEAATRALVRLHKIGLLVGGLSITVDELRHLGAHPADFAGFDLESAPVSRDDAAAVDALAPVLFEQWEALAAYARLRDELPQADATLLDAVAAPSGAEALERLAALTGWDSGALAFLASAPRFGLGDAAFRNAAGPSRLAAAMALSRRTGVAPAMLHSWATVEPDAAQAKEVVQAVRSRYDEESWLAVATPINDRLREMRRAALVSYVLAEKNIVEKGVETADQLFEYFLVDVQMDPSATTSRLKQAAASVQLFVQRCAMNLETGVSPSAIDAGRWAWMKTYRVWEANRKVFLYPENWIEPELRDDKTPLFKELETHLLQAPLTDEHVERGLLGYLEKLDVVADLEYAGICRETGDAAGGYVDRLHVFGRTRNAPRRHFYRQHDLRTGGWTPWSEVPLEIEVDHLVPVVWNRRLHLFWPVFESKADPDNKKSNPATEPPPQGDEPRQMIEIRLAWSEYRDGRWSPKTLGKSDPLKIRVYHPTKYNDPSEKIPFVRLVPSVGSDLVIEAFVWTPLEPVVWFWFRIGAFAVRGCGGEVRASARSYTNLHTVSDDLSVMRMPPGTLPWGMRFGEFSVVGSSPFAILSGAPPGDEPTYWDLQELDSETALATTPATMYTVLPPPVAHFLEGHPFVFQDGPRSYLVTSRHELALSQTRGARKHVGAAIRRMAGVAKSAPLPVPGARFEIAGSNNGTNGSRALLAATRAPLPSMSTTSNGHEATFAVDYQLTTAPTQFLAATGGDLHFQAASHAHVCAFIEALNSGGVPALLAPSTQGLNNDGAGSTAFEELYTPTAKVHSHYPLENVDFDGGAYSVYNWELFFHAPLFIADRLSKDQRFEEAQKWFHYIFDPTSTAVEPSPRRYWKFLPFHESDEAERLVDMLEKLSQGTPAEKQEIVRQVEAWRDNPFNPHRIARFRMVAYQKTVVMKYIQNLVAWADQLFGRDTIESINEATQLYVLAANLLGPRPHEIPQRGTTGSQTFNQLQPLLDGFSNALVPLENEFPYASETPSGGGSADAPLGSALAFYFCIPRNENLLALWDTVEDRLFKIRHGMNIEGVVRQLPLFEPPIDPALLVKATAMGVDIASVLSDVSSPAPHYRFEVLVRRALEVCAEVKSLGAGLLSVLDRKDAEALMGLRAMHETAALKSIREVRKAQIEEANEHVRALKKGRAIVEKRQDFYRDIEFMIPEEHAQNALAIVSLGLRVAGGFVEQIGAGLRRIPDLYFGALAGLSGGPINLQCVAGGLKNGDEVAATARVLGMGADVAHTASQVAGTLGGFRRRADEWDLQRQLASRELDEIDAQIAGADIRVAIAEKELSIHENQIENAEAVEEFLRSKYTNEELYSWMISQVSGVFFQTYRLAYDLAKRAEKAYRFELGLDDSDFIQFGYWDSLRRGLLSGERLHLDLARMHAAYLDANRREYEIDRAISLEQLAPMAFVALKQTGSCEVELPEAFFDSDYPGHYMRRIRNVRLTLPCVAGPYTNVNCTLTLLSSKVRVDPTAQGDYLEDVESEDGRFRYRFGPVQSIATSSGRNDAGLFEVSFRDERYLPFEGAGAVSRWRIELPRETNAFDVDTLSDVILHVAYSARDGGASLRQKALDAVVRPETLEGLTRLFSARHEFPDAWHRFLHPGAEAAAHRLDLDLSKERFPFLYKGKRITIAGVEIFLKLRDGVAYEGGGTLDLAREEVTIASGSALALHPTLRLPSASPLANGSEELGTWSIAISEAGLSSANLDPAAIEDVWILCTYSASAP